MFNNFLSAIFGETNNSTNSRGKKNPISSLFENKARGCYRCLYKLISFEQAKDMIERNQVLLIDVRTPGEYEVMHINGSINIPLDEIQTEILKYEKEKQIMIYCSSGIRSKTAIQILSNLGYNNIYIWEYSSLATFPYKNMLVYNKTN